MGWVLEVAQRPRLPCTTTMTDREDGWYEMPQTVRMVSKAYAAYENYRSQPPGLRREEQLLEGVHQPGDPRAEQSVLTARDPGRNLIAHKVLGDHELSSCRPIIGYLNVSRCWSGSAESCPYS